jgi:hypothetical protein
MYYDTVVRVLRYRRALDSAGAVWGASLPVAATSTDDFRFVLVDGRPSAYFRDRLDGPVMFIAANNAAGDYWGFASVVQYIAEYQVLAPFSPPGYSPFPDFFGFPAFTGLGDQGTEFVGYD